MEKFWLKYYPAGVSAEIEKTDATLVTFLEEVYSKYPKNRAFTCHGETLTFAKSIEYINNFTVY